MKQKTIQKKHRGDNGWKINQKTNFSNKNALENGENANSIDALTAIASSNPVILNKKMSNTNGKKEVTFLQPFRQGEMLKK